ncbi:MAG TPA: PLP-dependent aminotransferase family protein [Aliidongia sp.]|nr:PLP-dependent aminotransferase family protein [Aliidongia sp.]
METPLDLSLDRAAKLPLAEQIRIGIDRAIREGRLAPGARLPSWRDLAAQLGVARGTVRIAYERLIDTQLIVASGPAGTHVADQPPGAAPIDAAPERIPLAGMFHDFSAPPVLFQMGVPAQDAFPFKHWSRIMARAARAGAAMPVSYPDPRGEPELRREIAAYLALARGISCTPAQILVTGGYAGALGLVLRTLGLDGAKGWMEEPGYPIARTALELARVTPVPVRVDAEGLVVAEGIEAAADAAFAIVTPGQQAPLGVTLSLARRLALLDWAGRTGAWIIEDDYLSELQLKGRAAAALASLDRAGRVIHIGTFSKTLSPALRLGFVMVPPGLAARFGDVAACLAPAPNAAVQRAVAEFMREGHYLRHLRRMKRLYARRRDALKARLGGAPIEAMAGLAILRHLPDGTRDAAIAAEALAFGLAPVPLSPWYAAPGSRRAGLLLGVTNLRDRPLADACARLEDLIRRVG